MYKDSPLGEVVTGGDILPESVAEARTELGPDTLGAIEEERVGGLPRTGEPTTVKEEVAGSACKECVGDGGTGKERMGDWHVGLVGSGEVISGMGEEGCGENGKDTDCRGSEL